MDIEPGSREELILARHIKRRNQIEYMKILAVVNAIMSAGSNLIRALSNSETVAGGDHLKKTMDGLQGLLMPQIEEERKRKAGEAKSLLEKEMERGVLSFRVGQEQKRDLRRRKRR